MLRSSRLAVASAVALAVSVCLGAPASSYAELRAGAGDDPLDQQAKSLNPTYTTDLERVAVTYDDAAGTVTLAATFFQPGGDLRVSATLSRACDDDRTTAPQPSLAAAIGLDGSAARATLEGFEGESIATPELSADGRTITASFTNAEFSDRDWRCVLGDAGGSESGRVDDFGPFYFRGWAPDERPQGCTREQGLASAEDLLLPHAADTYPQYYEGIDQWSVGEFKCVDLTGDGLNEMVVELRCCTGGSLSPWAVFRSNAQGRWTMAYAQVRDNNRGIRRTGRTLRARIVARYEGACTSVYRDRIVRWTGSRFTTRVTRSYHRGRGC